MLQIYKRFFPFIRALKTFSPLIILQIFLQCRELRDESNRIGTHESLSHRFLLQNKQTKRYHVEFLIFVFLNKLFFERKQEHSATVTHERLIRIQITDKNSSIICHIRKLFLKKRCKRQFRRLPCEVTYLSIHGNHNVPGKKNAMKS